MMKDSEVRLSRNGRHHSAWGSNLKVIYDMFFGRLILEMNSSREGAQKGDTTGAESQRCNVIDLIVYQHR